MEPGGAATGYTYTPLGEITKVTDADGNTTTISYDGFGRRTEINNPDTGRTVFGYDPAGNMTRKVTAELGTKGKAIRYHYNHNRLVQIDYPFMDDVYYTYGDSGSGYNRAGRVYKTDNGTVSEELYFGKLGETVKIVRTINDGESSNSYTTKYAFDNLGRMRTLIYPDGEILTYSYGKGGLLKSAIGETSTGRKVYLEDMKYDEFGQRTYMKYGNGAESTYTYEPVMRRLTNLKTTSAEGKTLQNITYTYDEIGNITNRKNSEFNTTDNVSRNSEQSYSYDNRDRLTSSNGKFDYETWNPFWNKRVNTYSSDFEYNVTGKILRKNQQNKGLIEDTGETVTIAETTYDWNYEYSGSHPNAVTKAGTRTFGYDMNGNMTTMLDSSNSLTRSLLWDEENRLKKTTDTSTSLSAGTSGTNSIVTTYEYDAAGMRALKKGKYGTVQYVNENYVVRNKDLISKHVFAGNTRLVSNMVMREEKSGKMVSTEQGCYYYHADHLGSSSVVTDKNGKFYEQLEYFPYGETWVHNKAISDDSAQSTPYKFTGKEQDPETGLYYYGARYYDAKLSRWTAADPPMNTGEYLPVPPVNQSAKEQNANLPGMGGVFNPINLDAYQYAGQNPITHIDPDGNISFKIPFTDKYFYFQRKPEESGGGFRGGLTSEKDGRYIDPSPGIKGLITGKQKISFKDDAVSNKSHDKKVNVKEADMVEDVVKQTGFTININSSIRTTAYKGKKSDTHSKGKAVDIDHINGKGVKSLYKSGNLTDITTLQNTFGAHPNINGNYGPAYIEKGGRALDNEKLQDDHLNHIHADSK